MRVMFLIFNIDYLCLLFLKFLQILKFIYFLLGDKTVADLHTQKKQVMTLRRKEFLSLAVVPREQET